MLRPINYRQQVAGLSDEQARRLCRIITLDLVEGNLPAELEGLLESRELWKMRLGVAVGNLLQGNL
jgi:hypothetical protein